MNVYLAPQEKKQIKKETFVDGWYLEFIQSLADAGYKFSLTYAERGGFYTATAYGQYEEGPNAGYAMSLKHRDLEVALTSLWWCLEEAGLKGDWSERFTTGSDLDW